MKEVTGESFSFKTVNLCCEPVYNHNRTLQCEYANLYFSTNKFYSIPVTNLILFRLNCYQVSDCCHFNSHFFHFYDRFHFNLLIEIIIEEE